MTEVVLPTSSREIKISRRDLKSQISINGERRAVFELSARITTFLDSGSDLVLSYKDQIYGFVGVTASSPDDLTIGLPVLDFIPAFCNVYGLDRVVEVFELLGRGETVVLKAPSKEEGFDD